MECYQTDRKVYTSNVLTIYVKISLEYHESDLECYAGDLECHTST